MADIATKQEVDIDYVKQKLIAMQRQKAYGTVTIQFEGGVMQDVDMKLRFKPPSSRDYIGEGLENF